MEEATAYGFDAGVRQGQERASQYGIEVPFSTIEEAVERARGVVENWPNGLSGEFQAVYAENVTIASSARVRHEDQPLEQRALRALLGLLEVIFDDLVGDE